VLVRARECAASRHTQRPWRRVLQMSARPYAASVSQIDQLIARVQAATMSSPAPAPAPAAAVTASPAAPAKPAQKPAEPAPAAAAKPETKEASKTESVPRAPAERRCALPLDVRPRVPPDPCWWWLTDPPCCVAQERVRIALSIGEEVVQPDELRVLLDKKPVPVAYVRAPRPIRFALTKLTPSAARRTDSSRLAACTSLRSAAPARLVSVCVLVAHARVAPNVMTCKLPIQAAGRPRGERLANAD
jgi:hypothetical protein